MAIEQRTPFHGDQPVAVPANETNSSISRNVTTRQSGMKGWERQRLSNLFSNKNLLVCFRDPIDPVRIGRVGDYFGLEGLVER